ncbi:hypothetical protein ARMGADRAFT_582011 [Armillaria gallica]|uniref:Uncharacterized protein n=1 Tax=Armillaria gallica TaxID=47427 RepID=A0A2H3EGV3_ARMGA|nr:hypothetical protein ARMGADRAFT_582011 [Armillaria gallica]
MLSSTRRSHLHLFKSSNAPYDARYPSKTQHGEHHRCGTSIVRAFEIRPWSKIVVSQSGCLAAMQEVTVEMMMGNPSDELSNSPISCKPQVGTSVSALESTGATGKCMSDAESWGKNLGQRNNPSNIRRFVVFFVSLPVFLQPRFVQMTGWQLVSGRHPLGVP